MMTDTKKILPEDQHVFQVSIDVYEGRQHDYKGDDALLFAALEEIWTQETAHLVPSGHSYTESWEAISYSIVAAVDLTALADSLKWGRKHLIAIFGHLEKDSVVSIMLKLYTHE